MTEKKIVVQILPIAFAILALAKRIETMLDTLKDGVSEEEWAALTAERDAALDAVIGKSQVAG